MSQNGTFIKKCEISLLKDQPNYFQIEDLSFRINITHQRAEDVFHKAPILDKDISYFQDYLY